MNSVMMWIPEPFDFVDINFKELESYIKHFCKETWDKIEFYNYVMVYFLTKKLNFDPHRVDKRGYKTKLTTYIYKTVFFIKHKYVTDIIYDKSCTSAKQRRGLVPNGYLTDREDNMDFTLDSETQFKLKEFKDYLYIYFNKVHLKRWIDKACNVLDYMIKGYESSEIAKIYGKSYVHINDMKKELKEAFQSFLKEYA